MKKFRMARPLLRVAAFSGGVLTGCVGSKDGTQEMPGNPKGSMYDEQTTVLVAGTVVVEGPGTGLEEAAAVFVIVDSPTGETLARKKLPVGPFPMAFELTPSDRLPETAEQDLPQELSVRVIVDGDGDPNTHESLLIQNYDGVHALGSRDQTLNLFASIPLPGNPKGSMYDPELEEPIAAPKLDE